jgi:hypothetical protein
VRGVKKSLGEHLRDVVCGFGAYVGARLIWGPEKDVFRNLPVELLTFASLWILLQVLIRGYRYVRRSKNP